MKSIKLRDIKGGDNDLLMDVRTSPMMMHKITSSVNYN